jgi:electron transfer flavoprotein alpha subunit
VSGVLALAEIARGEVRPASLELIGAARALSDQGAGPVSVALIAHDGATRASALDVAGVQEIIVVASPCEHFEAHVSESALRALIERRRPSVVLAGHTIDSLGFLPAVAARARHGFASDVTAVSFTGAGLIARRGAYAERLLAELDFPGKETVLLTLRAGAFEAASGSGGASISTLELDLQTCARTEFLGLRPAPVGDVDITAADFLLSIGRGVEDAERVPALAELAAKMGATLSASRPLVDAGWIPSAQQVGQSGRTVAPRVYLALGISGAVQHLAGMSKAKTIIAVNSDPQAPIFTVAHYGAVADLFEVAAELERHVDVESIT